MDLIPRKFYIDDFFDNFVTSKEQNMKCDIYEKNGDYHIEMDIPGYDKKDIEIECKDGYLTISCEKEENEENIEKNYIRKERSFGKYSRSFYLGDINTNDINAKFNNGILSIVVPKQEIEESKKVIEIKD